MLNGVLEIDFRWIDWNLFPNQSIWFSFPPSWLLTQRLFGIGLKRVLIIWLSVSLSRSPDSRLPLLLDMFDEQLDDDEDHHDHHYQHNGDRLVIDDRASDGQAQKQAIKWLSSASSRGFSSRTGLWPAFVQLESLWASMPRLRQFPRFSKCSNSPDIRCSIWWCTKCKRF